MENGKRGLIPNMCECALNEIAVHHEFDSFARLLKFRKQNNSKTRPHSNVYVSTHKNTITFTGKLSVLKIEPERFRIANSNFDSISLIFFLFVFAEPTDFIQIKSFAYVYVFACIELL